MDKICCTCHLPKLLEDFNIHRGNKDGRQDRCRQCQKDWYQANATEHKKNVRRINVIKTDINRKFVWDYLLTHPCVDCNEQDPTVLDFDHVRGKKKSNVSQMVCSAIPVKRIMEEIAKCEVRCANCHRRKTAKQFGWYAWLNAA